MTRSKKPKAELPWTWVPPTGGYYRAIPGPDGIVDPPGPPPTDIPGTSEGLRRLEEERDRRAAERAG